MSDRPPTTPRPTSAGRDPRQVFVPAPADAPRRAPRRPTGPRPASGGTPPPRSPATARREPRPDPLRRRRVRLRLRLVGAVLALLVVVGTVAGYLWARSVFDRIDKVPVADVLSTGGSGTNYLLVGSDTRDGIDADDPNAGAFLGAGDPGGQRSDTMLVLHLEGGDATMLSIPRDLYVTVAETGRRQKINAAFNGGPTRLVRTIQDNLDIPIHHYVEVDFVSFAGMVDALGGITVEFPHPAFDPGSGLDVDRAGEVELDGTQALAYVRSRTYTELVDGQPRRDPTADLGRIKRQQTFLRSVMGKLGDSANPLTLARVAGEVAGGLRVDDRMSMWQALRFAWALRGLDPEPLELPTVGDRNEAGAVLVLRVAEAEPVLARFR